MERIYTKARKQYGKVYPAVATEFLAEVVKGRFIIKHIRNINL